MGKGSNQRPTNLQKYRENYDSIVWNKKATKDYRQKSISMFDLPGYDEWLEEEEEEE